ncbi:CpaF family protein [Amphritea balenae]|uniref:CpaF family protein n=1 Tax=Amphritea balenae TaxID=452629 RepID=A0A3P1SYJ0_9GAMM|nr:CpaF family protein [Amphritea balenae]RRD01183.1 CpaF family protein [Amphritea balenae]GGK59245.1 Flp pilus assembly protein TadA [Amphritea balenae]
MPFEDLKSYQERNTSSEQDEQAVEDVTFSTSSKLEKEWKNRIHKKLLKVMDLTLVDNLDPADARHQIREICQQLIVDEQIPCNQAARQVLIKQIEDEIMGLGPLEPLLADQSISDILVNGSHSVYVERNGKLQPTDVSFNNDSHLLNIIDRIVSSIGRRIDESSPMVDARLKDGSRVNAIIPPLALDGPSISIRRFSVERLTMDNLVELGSIPEELASVFKGIVKARLNILISGGTGSGKTTLLNILSGYIPKDERIVTIEDSAELQLQQPHTVRLETRPPNIEGKGQVSQRDLVRNSLRMRPDRIVIGEVRGGEALDMLQAMNTGHDGSLTTVHANSARDALGRIENMVSMSGVTFPVKALRAQIASAINIVIQIERMEDGKRRMTSLQEINGMEGDVVTMTELFKFERQGIDDEGNVRGHYRATGIIPAFYEHLKQRGIDLHFHLFDR